LSAALQVGISTCPNDTFAFHALLSGAVDPGPLSLEFRLSDVQELNEALLAGSLDVVKASFHAALLAGDDYVVLEVGSAVGFGVGPLLLAAGEGELPDAPRVLCPGEWTTATLLYRLYHAGEGIVEQVLFSEIMPALEAGRAELGVCIHEGRFTFREHGLRCVEDLGERWERDTGAPLPLGGILARRSLGPRVLGELQRAIGESLAFAHAHPREALATMRQHAAEQADEVLFQHVELYVNPWTRELGAEGRAALDALRDRAREAGLVAPDARSLEVFDG